MKSALKKLDRKFLIFACCLILIPVIIIIFLAIIQGCGNKKITYEKYENKMLLATQKYINNSDSVPKKENEYINIKLNTLVSKGYIKSTKKLLNDDSCDGNITVRRNGDVSEDSLGYLNYTVNLKCDKYETNSLKKLALKDLTSSESGLYKVGDNYIFKGDEVNNYLNFFGTEYRIISINKSGIAKIIKSEPESQNLYWDRKYNIETDKMSGINIYKDSYILKKLNDIYSSTKNFKDNVKSKIVSVDVCVDSRNINNYSMKQELNCSNVLENQKISLIGVTDYANASLDPNCKDITSKSCRNYNYMNGMSLYSWTNDVVSNNTYQVYYLQGGTIVYDDASRYNSYNIVLHIDSNEIISSGNGTKEKPYIIR